MKEKEAKKLIDSIIKEVVKEKVDHYSITEDHRGNSTYLVININIKVTN